MPITIIFTILLMTKRKIIICFAQSAIFTFCNYNNIVSNMSYTFLCKISLLTQSLQNSSFYFVENSFQNTKINIKYFNEIMLQPEYNISQLLKLYFPFEYTTWAAMVFCNEFLNLKHTNIFSVYCYKL